MRDPLGAFCQHASVEIEGAPSGPLKGLAFGVKDLFDIAGHRTGFGSPDWLATHPPAAKTAPAVQALLDAGARVAGKTQSDELAWSLTGINFHYGTPVNPAAPDRLPGGSSSGSAAAVAGGLCDFALGTDTGGSVRGPASFCGIFGFRPSHGAISLEGVLPLAASFDTVGWFARNAAMLERVGQVLLEDAPAAPGPSKVLVANDAFAAAGRDTARALKGAVERVCAAVGKCEPVTVSEKGLAEWREVFRVLQGAEVWAQHGEWVKRVQPKLGPGVKERMQWASTLAPEAIAAAKAQREAIGERLDQLLQDSALLCLPTAPGIAPLRTAAQDELEAFRARAQSLLCIAPLARLPQVSLPLATLDGCPLGLALIARRGCDLLLLAWARSFMENAAAAAE